MTGGQLVNDPILDTIDNALNDWGTSGDAMRWKPEPPALRVGPPRLRPSSGLQRVSWAPVGSTDWQTLAVTSAEFTADVEDAVGETWDALQVAMRPITIALNVQAKAAWRLVQAFNLMAPELLARKVAQDAARRTAMHSAYHRRRNRR